MTTRPPSKRDADATTPVRTTFLRRGEASAIHRHTDTASWVHVVTGAMVDERWTRDGSGFVHERRVLERGQALAAPGDALHRVRAIADVVFVTTCTCGCAQAAPVEEAELAAVRRSTRPAAEEASITALGEPAPL